MPLRIVCIIVCSLASSLLPISAWGGEQCRDCHRLKVEGKHGRLACGSCHGSAVKTVANPAAASHGASGCVNCHRGFERIFSQPMGSRVREKAFVDRAFASVDPGFFADNCRGCHLRSCLDCHGADGHRLARPRDRQCLACHAGYFVGSDYYGMAPREDNLRYQRGEKAYGRHFLKMAPDVHAEAGITCSGCHGMASLVAGGKSSRSCRDCHTPDRKVIEHRITAHLERMECYACHSAWAPQEYGSFFLRFLFSTSRDNFDLPQLGTDYLKSAYLRSQDPPPLGLNSRGLVSPIRPEFIAYYSEIRKNRPVGKENRLLVAEWKAFFPHTIQRGTVMCEGCHDAPRRFLLEPERERIYSLKEDGMALASFWDRNGQRVVNGAFLPLDRYAKMSTGKPAYRKAVVEKWQRVVKRVAPSSHR